MAYSVERAVETDRDLEAIFDFLVRSYIDFGDSHTEALSRAAKRLEAIEKAAEKLGTTPHQGTLREDLAPGIRCVTKRSAVFYFDVDDERRLVRVLAIFFGGQDHQRAMLVRLLSKA